MESLRQSSRPFVAWRSRDEDLLCLSMSEGTLSRLVPHQVYLSLQNDRETATDDLAQRRKNWRYVSGSPLPAGTDLDWYFFYHVETMALHVRYEAISTALPGYSHVPRRHVSRGGPDGILSWSTIGTKLTVVKLTTVSLQDASAELTRISLLDLKVVCQQKGIQTESLLTVGLGLLRAYRQGVRRMHCFVSRSSDSSGPKYNDRVYVRLECSNVLGVAVRGSWGGVPEKKHD